MANTIVRMSTTKGDIVIELADDKSPVTAANFASYVKSGFYDGTIFHRVIPGFMIQGGGMLPGMSEKDTGDPIRNEAANGLSNARGTIAMARTSDPHSATAQFFINLVNNDRLDYRASTPAGFGYCVFGKVIEGMEAVDAIAKAPTGPRAPHDDVPKEDIVILKAKIE